MQNTQRKINRLYIAVLNEHGQINHDIVKQTVNSILLGADDYLYDETVTKHIGEPLVNAAFKIANLELIFNKG